MVSVCTVLHEVDWNLTYSTVAFEIIFHQQIFFFSLYVCDQHLGGKKIQIGSLMCPCSD